MKTITYQDNMQLWRMESAAEKAGYKKTDDCYWCQIFRNSETGGEFCTSREEDSTMNTYKVTFSNGDYLYTQLNASIEEAKAYYLGNIFNLGTEADNLQKCVDMEEVAQ